MLQGLIVAAVLVVSPTQGIQPAPAASPEPLVEPVPSASVAFAQLRNIASVHSTPFCTALRTKIGPAVGNMLVADNAIAASVPIYAKMYRDDIIFRSKFMEFDVIKLENLIRPLTNTTLGAQALLDSPSINVKEPKTDDDRRLLDMRAQLDAILQKQKDVANLVSGFVDTYQLGQMMNAGPPAGWLSALQPKSLAADSARGTTPRPWDQSQSQAPAGASDLLEPQAQFRGGLASPPEFDPYLAALGHDPYAPFAEWTSQKRSTIAQGEALASQAIIAAAKLCK